MNKNWFSVGCSREYWTYTKSCWQSGLEIMFLLCTLRLVPEHFGFRKGTSTEDAIYQPTDRVFKPLNQNGMLEDFYAI